jgi:hypothetical protein
MLMALSVYSCCAWLPRIQRILIRFLAMCTSLLRWSAAPSNNKTLDCSKQGITLMKIALDSFLDHLPNVSLAPVKSSYGTRSTPSTPPHPTPYSPPAPTPT